MVEAIEKNQKPETQKDPDKKLEQISVDLAPLTPERLDEALSLARVIFPDIGSSEEPPDIVFPASLEPGKYREQLERFSIDKLNYWLAQENGKSVGIMGLYSRTEDPNDTAWVGWYGVTPEARGRGVGGKIFQETIDKARTEGVKELKLYTTDEDDPVAHTLFEKFGFTISSEETAPEGYKITYMSKRLDEAPQERSFMQRLIERSRYTRDDPSNFNTGLERNGEKFTTETIESIDHPDFPKMLDLFRKTFKPDEVDSPETMQQYMEESELLMHIMKNDKDEVVAALLGYRFDMGSNDPAFANKSIFGVDMVTTNPEYQRKGLARELYISAAMKAEKNAQAEGKKTSLAMGECTSTSEKFWNDVGWKRIYTVDTKNKKLTELKYVQPPVEFDAKTGKSAEGLSAIPEHFMTDSLERKTPPTKEEIAAVGAEWLSSFAEPQDSFESPEAYTTHEAMMQGYVDDFQKQLTGAERTVLLTERARRLLLRRGWSIEEHTAADGGVAGPEDF
ncbi:GNAT family N-acetyltransferase [Candidatus Parcubacteria bacterium]|nr:MAG: GNAT family N-acetyltransferase [Candidatus Parcubacteria bacterium]